MSGQNNEQQAVEYIRKQINLDRPESILAVYNQLVEQNVFHTQVGYDFLVEMKEYLIERLPEKAASIKSIPTDSFNADVAFKKDVIEELLDETPVRPIEKNRVKKKIEKKQTNSDSLKTKNKSWNYKRLFYLCRSLCVVLIIIIVAMFVISSTSNSPTIINYENKLIDKYASWEQELTNREADVRQREIELDEKEKQLKTNQDAIEDDSLSDSDLDNDYDSAMESGDI